MKSIQGQLEAETEAHEVTRSNFSIIQQSIKNVESELVKEKAQHGHTKDVLIESNNTISEMT